MKKGIVFTLMLVLFTVNAFAKSNNAEAAKEAETVNMELPKSQVCAISGTILDVENNETLAGATITINGKKYYSNLDGQFNIPALNQGKHRLSVELISYNVSEIEVDVQYNRNITVRLAQN